MAARINLISPELRATIETARKIEVGNDRKAILQPLVEYIQAKVDQGHRAHLNFICTHNSRRSQLSQVWAHTAANYFGVPATCCSGGVEVTAFNERAVASLMRSGFRVTSEGEENREYTVYYSENRKPIRAFSKLYDDPENAASDFAAVMTCSDADENCPFIPGTEARIPVRYKDPKEFDGTPEEALKYDERSLQIASEMFYVFSQIKNA
ncbi:MAG: protein-tyrosine-phosphatase [Robiginitalea sp.]